jgi:23S rRNA-intervening sequence protein
VKSDGRPHRKLKVWQAGMDFVVELYRELENFPAREQFGLTAQLRRAAVSIPSNIAEGSSLLTVSLVEGNGYGGA